MIPRVDAWPGHCRYVGQPLVVVVVGPVGLGLGLFHTGMRKVEISGAVVLSAA